MTTLLRPAAVADVDALAQPVRLLAGGTDLLVQRRAGLVGGPLADISALPDAPPAVAGTDGALRLSALAPLSAVAAGLGARLPGLRSAIAAFASEQIRNRATLGGNLANASPAADCVPPLVAAGAVVNLRGPDGRRVVAVTEFATGPRSTCLRPGEWIETVDVPERAGEQGFRKIAGRQALAISVVSLAWSWRREPDGTLRDVRIAAGAVAPVVVRCPGAEAALEGRRPDPDVVDAAARALHADIAPIDDLRASAGYRYAAAAGALTEAVSFPYDRTEIA